MEAIGCRGDYCFCARVLCLFRAEEEGYYEAHWMYYVWYNVTYSLDIYTIWSVLTIRRVLFCLLGSVFLYEVKKHQHLGFDLVPKYWTKKVKCISLPLITNVCLFDNQHSLVCRGNSHTSGLLIRQKQLFVTSKMFMAPSPKMTLFIYRKIWPFFLKKDMTLFPKKYDPFS